MGRGGGRGPAARPASGQVTLVFLAWLPDLLLFYMGLPSVTCQVLSNRTFPGVGGVAPTRLRVKACGEDHPEEWRGAYFIQHTVFDWSLSSLCKAPS